MFKLGLIINPLAGIGGSVALKGSDGEDTVTKALSLGAQPKSQDRTAAALRVLQDLPISIITYPNEMGQAVATKLGFETTVVGEITSGHTSAQDTERAAQQLRDHGVDLILFAGGDGTARNICHAVGDTCPVLGVPAGVKIHSGVYAVTPKAAGEIVKMLVEGDLVSLTEQDVRDIDEDAFREGKVKAKHYGELRVPQEHRYLQSVKESGKEIEALVLDDIAADFEDKMESGVRYIMGSGGTVAAIMEHLGLDNTLLGVDVVEDGEVIASDCTAEELLALSEGVDCKLVITLIGGQGHIIGRGNQQLSPALLSRLGPDALWIVATKTKLNELNGKPLIVDSGDEAVNTLFTGSHIVHTGFDDAILYRATSY